MHVSTHTKASPARHLEHSKVINAILPPPPPPLPCQLTRNWVNGIGMFLFQTEAWRRRREAGVKQSMEIRVRSCTYVCGWVGGYVLGLGLGFHSGRGRLSLIVAHVFFGSSELLS